MTGTTNATGERPHSDQQKSPSFDKEGFGGFVDIREAAATGENALWTTIRIDLPVRKTFRFVDTA